MPSERSKIAASYSEEYQQANTRIDLLQRLLSGAISQHAFQAYESKLLLQTPRPSIDFKSGIDLETDNLVTHFSKLWLRRDPDQSFFQATHPVLVKLRQQEIPRWQQSKRWNTWSDFQVKSKYQELTYFDVSLLPTEKECRDLFTRFVMSYDWYFELLTETESNLAQAEIYQYQALGLTPTSPKQWTQVALALAVCRLTLAGSVSVSEDQHENNYRSRYETILNWCDLSVMALQQAGMDQNPTVEGMRVLIILTSTIFFETDCGLMGSAPQMFRLYGLALDMSERMNLHRDPPPHMTEKEMDDRRRMWWALVTIDAHFCSTVATSKGPLRLQNSDTRLPVPRKTYGQSNAVKVFDYSYLRSSRSRFDLGRINNQCCHLLAQRRPLPTLSDIWKLDQDLVALEENVPIEHRLTSDLDLATLFQRPLRPSEPMDYALRNGQLIFYIGCWHIRSKIHRGLLYLKHTNPLRDKTLINIDAHRDIVKRCSYSLVHLYRHTNLPTAFTSAIASASLTLLLELVQQPSQPYNHDIRTIVLECFSRFQIITSPIIHRACQVLEYFLQHLQPRVGISENLSGSNQFQIVEPCLVGGEDSLEITEKQNPSNILGAHESQSNSPENSQEFITHGPSGALHHQGNHRNPDHHLQISPVHNGGSKSICNQNFELASKQSTIHSKYQNPGAITNEILKHVTEGEEETFLFQDTEEQRSLKQFLEFELGGHCGSMQQSSQIIDPSRFHIGSSDLPIPSVTQSGGYGVQHVAMLPSSVPPRDESDVTRDEFNTIYPQNSCPEFTSTHPVFDLTNSIAPATLNDLLKLENESVSFQHQEYLQKPGIDGLFDFQYSDLSNNLREEWGVSAGSSSSIGPPASSNNPPLRMPSSDYLSHIEAMPMSSSINNPNFWCKNVMEPRFTWIEPGKSSQPVRNLSADEMDYYQRAKRFVRVTDSEQEISRHASRVPSIHNSFDMQLSTLSEQAHNMEY